MRLLLLLNALLLPAFVACGGEWSSLATDAPPPRAPLRQAQPVQRVVEGHGTVAELRLSLWQESYDVYGSTPAEVRASLDAAAPLANGNARFDAVTSWDLTWTFHYARDNGLCSLASAVVNLDVVIILPALIASDAHTASMQTRWDAYIAALQAHEEGHRERQEAAARQLRNDLEAAPSAMECRELARMLNARAEETEQAMRAADVRYDIETDHGRLQGAVYP